MRLAAILAAFLTAATLSTVAPVSSAAAAPPSTCGGTDVYTRALCAYQHRRFAEAEAELKTIAELPNDPKAIPAVYFLARTAMKQGHYDEASTYLYRIYEQAPSFYREWNCDFLLGECRKALGKG
jgi:TolA-binding protein